MSLHLRAIHAVGYPREDQELSRCNVAPFAIGSMHDPKRPNEGRAHEAQQSRERENQRLTAKPLRHVPPPFYTTRIVLRLLVIVLERCCDAKLKLVAGFDLDLGARSAGKPATTWTL